MKSQDKIIFSQKLKVKDNKCYFFDVKESSKGTKYLLISESKKDTETGKWKHHRVIVFDEDIGKFLNAIKDIESYFDISDINNIKSKRYIKVEWKNNVYKAVCEALESADSFEAFESMLNEKGIVISRATKGSLTLQMKSNKYLKVRIDKFFKEIVSKEDIENFIESRTNREKYLKPDQPKAESQMGELNFTQS